MEYTVVYSARKTISISVNNSVVTVKAPIGTDSKMIENIVLKHSKWIEKNIEYQRKKQEREKELSPEEVKRLKKEARIYFSEKLEYYSRIMGLKYSRMTITSAKKRFGSCSSKASISFSYRLMLYPEDAREYVVVHELAHLKEMNHSKRFYEIIASVLPDYKYRKRLLK